MLLSFPENVSENPTWVKYDIWEYIPKTQGGKALSGSHFNSGVSKNAIASIALSSDAPVTTTENQGWKQEAGGGILEQLGNAALSVGVGKFLGKDVVMPKIDLIAAGKESLIAGSGLSSFAGIAMVEKMALKYDGPEGQRSFTMTHTFVPRNRKESFNARAIINTFRMHSAPEKDGNSEIYLSYKFPSLFTVTQMAGSGINSMYPAFNTCYCKSVTAKFGDATNNTFNDTDAPTTMEVSLQFEEIAISDRQSIIGGY